MSVLRVPTFHGPLVFVDIETNGLSHTRGRIIEIAAIRVEAGQVVRSFTTLLDPETPLPVFITRLTGINEGDLAGAPTFDQIADELRAVLDGAIFVAHNVRFDYAFIKQEFARLNLPFLPKQLCTVKLSRALHPHERGHKLADLIQRHGLKVAKRHRAYDDAAALWQFIQYLSKHFPPEQIEAAIARQIRQPALPKGVNPELVQNLPDGPGVYIFEDQAGRPLYVGKSINIKKRVLSHFGRDHAESKEFKISQNVYHIRTEETPGELSALLLESRLVKELQPLYNRKLRRTQKLLLLCEVIDAEGYATVALEEAQGIEPTDLGSILAVYTHRSKARQTLETITKLYDLCPKLMGLEKASGSCFWRQLKKCRGACTGEEIAAAYNRRVQLAFERQRLQAWPYQGAVLVEERRASEPHALVVDRWCVLGELLQEAGGETVWQSQQGSFDLDTYNILQRFMVANSGTLRVRPLRPADLQNFKKDLSFAT